MSYNNIRHTLVAVCEATILSAGILVTGCTTTAQNRSSWQASQDNFAHSWLHSSESKATLTTSHAATNDSRTIDNETLPALNNPSLRAACHAWQAKRQRAPQLAALPDPRLTYKHFIEEVETRVGPQKLGIGVTQKFPWFGKLAHREKMADHDTLQYRQMYDSKKWSLFREVKEAYFDLYYLGQAILVVQRNQELVRDLEVLARARYRTALTGHAELLRAQVELGKLEDQLNALEDLRSPVIARLNAALNRKPSAALLTPSQVSDEMVDADDDQLVEWLKESNPALAAARSIIARLEQGIELAQLDGLPDFTVGFNYSAVGSPPRGRHKGIGNPAAQRSLSRLASGIGDPIVVNALAQSFLPSNRPSDTGDDIWQLSLSLNLPIRRDKYKAKTLEARSRYLVAINEKTNRENNLFAMLKRATYEYRDALRKMSLYHNTLIPKAVESLEATSAAYHAGSSSFLDVIDAERTLLDFKLTYERAAANRGKRIAEIEMLIGRQVSKLADARNRNDMDYSATQ